MSVLKIANLIIKRLNLTLPIDVDAAIAPYADLEECDWRHDCDGVAILSAERPKIFVRRDRPSRRKKFTKAHELGHAVIGWHLGSVQCVVDPVTADQHGSLKELQESEANAFASHLLVPDSLISGLGLAYCQVSDALAVVEQADVSAAAGVMALRRVLLPGYAFQVSGVALPILSSGTDLPSYADFQDLSKWAVRQGTCIHQDRKIRWFQFAEARDLVHPAEDAKSLLYPVLREARPAEDPERLKKSIYGVIGGVIGGTLARAGVCNVAPEQLLGILYYKFSIHQQYGELMQFSQFERFLSARAYEISQQRQQ